MRRPPLSHEAPSLPFTVRVPSASSSLPHPPPTTLNTKRGQPKVALAEKEGGKEGEKRMEG